MKNAVRHLITAVTISSAMILTGCGSSDDPGSTLTLDITDAPVDNATEVIVEFTGVEVKPTDGQAMQFDFDAPRQIDLLALQDGTSTALLSDEEVAAGSYEWIRLKVNAMNMVMDSYITFEDGGQHSLFVPSGSESGLKLVQGFNIAVGQPADFTIDFDLRKSIVNPMSAQVDYILKPALRIVDNTEVGDIVGSVSNITMEQSACIDGGVVYVYDGSGVTADDLGSDTAPLTSANVTYNEGENTYGFIVAFLSPGDYTLALTCDAANDDPETDDDITFLQSLDASVSSDATTEVSFD